MNKPVPNLHCSTMARTYCDVGKEAGRNAVSAEALIRELLEAAGVELGGPELWDITVHDDRLWDRVIRDRELGFGESYQDGWWDCPRTDLFLERVLQLNPNEHISPSPTQIAQTLLSQITNRQNLKKAKENASAHYDVGNDLYERMLDSKMIYSCGYWCDSYDLEGAQTAKLDLICRKLRLEPGMRLLDIGCGWGGLAKFAAEKYGVDVVGISPAIEQVKVARERTAGLPVNIKQLDYRSVTGTFDRITSVGMLEHVGPKNYKSFFEACDSLLADDGQMLHHTIGSNETKNRTDPWFDKYIFPGGVTPSLGQLTEASQDVFSTEDVHNFGPDYDKTLMAWWENISERWHEIPNYDERFRRTWNHYLLTSAASFRVRNLQLWQIVYTRNRHVVPTYIAVR